MVFNGKKDMVSGALHGLGLLLSVAGTVLLCVAGAQRTVWHVVSYAIYGASMTVLYGASTYYHLFHVSDKARAVARKVDHCAIFLLIAGTYTPMCLLPLRGVLGWWLFGVIWFFALAGVMGKLFFMNAPRWLYTLLYVLMGWTVMFATVPLVQAIGYEAFFWLLAGGVMYTLGSVLYALKWPNFKSEYVGFHELFHVFVLAGSLCHFYMIYHFFTAV